MKNNWRGYMKKYPGYSIDPHSPDGSMRVALFYDQTSCKVATITNQEFDECADKIQSHLNRPMWSYELKDLAALLVDSKYCDVYVLNNQEWEKQSKPIAPTVTNLASFLPIPTTYTKTQYVEYSTYILSEDWNTKRKSRLAKDNYQCAICGTGKNLSVHHITYERLGSERLDDLITLCKDCHKQVHKNDLASKNAM